MLLLVLLAPLPAAAQVAVPFGLRVVRSSLVARQLAKEVKKVRRQFRKGRKALEVSRSPGGEPVYERAQVQQLVDATEEDLDRAIEKVGEPGLAAMRDWVEGEFRKIHAEMSRTAAGPSTSRRRAPRPVMVLASLGLGRISEEEKDQGEEEGSPGGDVDKKKGDSLLDQVGEVIQAIFRPAKKVKLQIDLRAESIPVKGAALLIWPPSNPDFRRGATTDGPIKRVWIGAYLYSLEREGYPVLACPRRPGGDPESCWLDLMGSPKKDRRVRCRLEAPPDDVAGCRLLE